MFGTVIFQNLYDVLITSKHLLGRVEVVAHTHDIIAFHKALFVRFHNLQSTVCLEYTHVHHVDKQTNR